MKYPAEVYAQAEQQLKDRRQQNINTQLQRKQKVYALCEEIAQIDRKLESTGLEVVKSVLTAKNSKDLIEGLRLRNEQLIADKKRLLTQYNFPEDYLDPIYTCEECNDSGYIGGKKCSCYKKLLASHAYNTLNENSSLQLTNFRTFHLDFFENTPNSKGVVPRVRMSEIYEFCKSYTENFNEHSPSLYFYGATGLGKTHLAMAIANDVLEKGYGVVYSVAQNLLSEIEKEHFSYGKENKTLESVLQCDLLVLDDLGAEYTTPFTLATINNIILTRLNNKKPTIITTSLDFVQLEKAYQSRIVSRITGGYVTLGFAGNDIRIYKRIKGIQ